MEPVEAVRYNLPDGGEGWLSKWEKQHDRPRRATESTFDFNDKPSAQWAQNRRCATALEVSKGIKSILQGALQGTLPRK